MPLAAVVQQNLIVTTLGDINGLLAANIATLWSLHDDQLNAAVKFLLVKRGAVDMLIGSIRDDVTFRADTLTVNLSDKLKMLEAMKPTDVDIQRAYRVSQGAAYAAGALAATTPSTPPSGQRDANDPRYTGSPYWLPWPWGTTGY